MFDRRAFLRAGGGLTLGAIAGLALNGSPDGATPASASALRAGAVPPAEWEKLRSRLQGQLVLPGDATYDYAKQLEVAEYDAIHPQGIVYCTAPEDVQECIRFAQRHALPTRTRSGGHNFAGWSTGEGMVIDLSRINHVNVGSSTVRLGPGVRAIDALSTLHSAGKQMITGTCPTVCPGGFLHGGGIGLQARKFGVGCDRLTAARVVLADGRVVRCTSSREPDLYWALRGGGGGNFGIVVEYEVQPISAPNMVFFTATWAWDHAQSFFESWQEWVGSGSRNLGTIALAIQPADASAPALMLQGGYFGPRAELDAALQDLTSAIGAAPLNQVVEDLSYFEGMKRIYGCGELTVQQCHRVGENPEASIPRTPFLREAHRLFSDPMPSSALSDLLASYEAGRRPGQTRYLAAWALGGAANDLGRTATAYVHRDSTYLIGSALVLPDPEPPADEEAAAEAWVQANFSVLDPHSNGEAYINFPDPRLPNWQQAYYGENYTRLLDVKRRYDPGNFFRHPRSIGA